MLWIKFFLSALVIVFAGVRLTKYADALSVRMNWGHAWVGIVLLGLVTSLPEAITSVVAVARFQAGDLAMGNVLGSNIFNPMLIVLLDFVYRKESVTNAVHANLSHKASALYAVGLTVVIVLGMTLGVNIGLGTMGWAPLAAIVLYVVGMRHLATLEGPSEDSTEENVSPSSLSMANIVLNLLLCAAFIVAAANVLAGAADQIAVQTGLGRTFVGSIFLALVTSLPEMVVTLSALKMGSLDLAVGNIFGSNMTNIFIVAVCDVFDSGGAILANLSSTHYLSAGIGILLTLIVIKGIFTKNKRCFMGLGVDSLVMLVVYITGTILLYIYR